MIFEVSSFGGLSHLYQNLKPEEVDGIFLAILDLTPVHLSHGCTVLVMCGIFVHTTADCGIA